MKQKYTLFKVVNKKMVIIILEKIIKIIKLQLFLNEVFKGRLMSDKTRIILKGVLLILSLIKNFLELKEVNIKILIETVIYLFDL